jgi:hypothetical protein
MKRVIEGKRPLKRLAWHSSWSELAIARACLAFGASDLNAPKLLDGHAQAAVISSVLDRTVRYLDVSADDFIGQLKGFGLPPWMAEAFGVAVADPEILVTSRAPKSSRSFRHAPPR